MSGIFDATRLTDGQLERFISYHRTLGNAGAGDVLTAVEELAKRRDKGLTVRRTVEIVRTAAASGRFVTYGEIAAQSGRPWNAVRYRVYDHLGVVCEWSYRALGQKPGRGGPLLSAVVVAQENSESGDLTGQTLDGFIRFACSLGLDADGTPEKREAFYRGAQRDVFEWARRGQP